MHIDKQYFNIIDKILKEGKRKSNRTGIDTISISGCMVEHDMSEGFPILSSKRIAWKTLKVELEGFIKGITDKRWFENRGSFIWSDWANPLKVPYGTDEESKGRMRNEPDLGNIYGYIWGNLGSHSRNIVEVTPRVTKHTIGLNLPKGKDICGIATRGFYKRTLSDETEDILYKNWYDMIRRCYIKSSSQYKYYGALGKRVCDRWLTYSNYRTDIERLPRWQDKMREPRRYHLDKDYYGSDHYAPDVCVFLDLKENIMYNNSSLYSFTDGECEHTTLTIKELEQLFDVRTIKSYISSGKKYRGYTFKQIAKEGKLYRYQLPCDQLKQVIDTLKTDPNSRRLLVDAWVPSEQANAALPPCHYAFQLLHNEGVLDLSFNMRSSDVFLGLPFNIASYALLLELIAKECGMRAGKLIGFLADTHIYVNHLEQIEEQRSRELRNMPNLMLDYEYDGIFNWSHECADLEQYQPHGPIKAEVAV